MNDSQATHAHGGDSLPPAPDYPTPIVGYRAMRVIHGGRRLASPLRLHHTWRPGAVATARCGHESHPAPDPDCRCGLYARLTVAEVAKTSMLFTPWPTLVIARVEAWGDSYLGPSGIRAERMRIVGLLDAPFTSEDRGVAAVWYDVPLEPYEGPDEPADPGDSSHSRLASVGAVFASMERAIANARAAVGHVHVAYNGQPITVRGDQAGDGYHHGGRARDVICSDGSRAASSVLVRVGEALNRAGYRVGGIVRDGVSSYHAGITRVARALAPERVASDCAAGDCPLPSRANALTCGRHAHVTDLERPRGGGDPHGHRTGAARDHRRTGRRGATSARRARGG